MVEGTPPGDAPPPSPQRATLARKGARCGAGAGSPRPHRPHPGHTGSGTLAACSRGRATGRGTAPDTRRPSQRWQATPPGDGPPPPPRHAAPTGHAGQGDSVGPPHPHTRAHSTWVADPNSPPDGRAAGGGTAPDLRRPSQWWKAPPPGTPWGWAPEAEWGRAPCDRRGAGPQKPSGAGPRATAVGLSPRNRVGQGPVRPPRGWAPEAEWGRAPCDRRGAGPQKPSGAGPRATAVGLGPRSRVGQGPV